MGGYGTVGIVRHWQEGTVLEYSSGYGILGKIHLKPGHFLS